MCFLVFHLMDEREAEEENRAHVANDLVKTRRFSTAELNLPFRDVKKIAKREVKGWMGNKVSLAF